MKSRSHLFWLASNGGKPEHFSSHVFPSLGSSIVLSSGLFCIVNKICPINSPSLAFHLARSCLKKSKLTSLCPLKDQKLTERLLHFRQTLLICYTGTLLLHNSEKAQIHTDFFAALYVKALKRCCRYSHLNYYLNQYWDFFFIQLLHLFIKHHFYQAFFFFGDAVKCFALKTRNASVHPL